MIRKILCTLSCFLLLATLLSVPFPVLAAGNPAHGTITVGTVDAAAGDSEVIIPIMIENNPGIMAITISITYDKEALSYIKYDRGYLKDYTVADHPDKSLIRFVNCETKDRKAFQCRNCGNVVVQDEPPEICPNEDCNKTRSYHDKVIMFSLRFRVNENASFDLHPITIDYKVGDFCNWKLQKLTPVIVPGGVNVAFNGNNCKHPKYSDWEDVVLPGCTSPGKKQHNCQKCGHAETVNIPAVGHSYEDTWTIDREATKDQSGVMSRHCIRCDSKVDLLTFTLKESEKEKFDNKENTELEKNKYVEQLIKEQLPDGITVSKNSDKTRTDASQTSVKESDHNTSASEVSKSVSKPTEKNSEPSKASSEKAKNESKLSQQDSEIQEPTESEAPKTVDDPLSPAEKLLALIPNMKVFLTRAAALLYLLLRLVIL